MMDMLRRLPFLLKPLLRAVIELIFYAPIWLTLGIYTLPLAALPLWTLLLLVMYCLPQYVLYRGRAIKNGTRILAVVLLGVLPMAIIATIFSGQVHGLAWLAGGAVGIAFAESSFRSLRQGWHNSFSSIIMMLMVLAAIVLQILKVTALHELVHYNWIYFTLGIAACILYLYINNERTIRDQQMIDSASATIRRSVGMNRVYITIIALLVTGIALFRSVQEKLEQWIKQLYQALLAWLFREREAGEMPPAEQPPPPMDSLEHLGEVQEPSKFWLMMEQILKWVAIVLLAAAAIALIYYTITKLIPMLLRLIHRMLNHRALLKQGNEGYEDEIEGIAPQKSKVDRSRNKASKSTSLKQWDKLSSTQKLKALYVHVLKYGLRQGEPITASKTAQENLQLLMKDDATNQLYGELLQGYNDMRYGSAEPHGEQLEKLRNQVEQEQQKNKRSVK